MTPRNESTKVIGAVTQVFNEALIMVGFNYIRDIPFQFDVSRAEVLLKSSVDERDWNEWDEKPRSDDRHNNQGASALSER